jgi:hypothetical protein
MFPPAEQLPIPRQCTSYPNQTIQSMFVLSLKSALVD